MATIFGWLAGLEWSSFIPDTVVALLTGVAVAAGVFCAERRVGRRDEAKASTDSQWQLLESVRMWMTGPIQFQTDSLRPSDKKLDQVLTKVRALPDRQERETVPGIWLLRRLVVAHESLERATLDLEQAIAEHSSHPDNPQLTDYVYRAIHSLAAQGDVSFCDWPVMQESDAPYAIEVADDHRIRGSVDLYLLARSTLCAICAAFGELDGGWRFKAWQMTLERSRQAPRTRFGRWRANRLDERKLRVHQQQLEAKAYEQVAKVNPHF